MKLKKETCMNRMNGRPFKYLLITENCLRNNKNITINITEIE